MDCPSCGGNGVDENGDPICDECEGHGVFRVVGCAKRFVGREIFDVVQMANLYEKGIPPVMTGSLGQSHWFVMACSAVFREQNYWKRKLGIF